jgi:ankyrin repeat protein
MKTGTVIRIVSLATAVLMGVSACGTGRTEVTSTQSAGKAAAQQAGAAADPDTKGAQIFKAAQNGDLDQLKALLEAGARPDYTNSSGVTPLMVAAGLGNTGIAKALLDRGADENAKTPGGYTPLMAAALNGQKEMVQLLMARGADPGARDVSGKTAAGYAQDHQHSEIVGLLSRASAR